MHQTRQRLIEFLKKKGQATVDELSGVVKLTPMAVRYHLNILQADKLVVAARVRRQSGPGRPQQVYELTEAADKLFPVDYYSLAEYLLDELDERLGHETIENLFGSIARRLAGEAPPGRRGQTFEERLDEVVDFLSEKGFSIGWEMKDEGGYIIRAHSCPYRQVARSHQAVCLLDRQVISTMLKTDPIRLTCLTNGDDYCSYHVTWTSPPA